MNVDTIQHYPEDGVLLRRPTDDGRQVDFCMMIYTWRIAIGPQNSQTYDEFYCFKDYGTALVAFLEYTNESECVGWVRHVPSHRRRPEGDAAKEYIEA